jgi:hypothetical protein
MEALAHGLTAVLKATTVELLPERIDLIGFALQLSGLFAILGTAALLIDRRLPRWIPRRVEIWALAGAGAALVLFLVVWLIDELP